MHSEDKKALEDGWQRVLFFAVVQRVGVPFLAVGWHREDGWVLDARLDVAEVRAAGESNATWSRMWTWARMWAWSRMWTRVWMWTISINISMTTAHKPPQ